MIGINITTIIFVIIIIVSAIILIRLIKGIFKIAFTLFAIGIVFGAGFYAINIIQGKDIDLVGFLTGKIPKEDIVKQKEVIIDSINQSLQDKDFKKVVSLIEKG